MATIAELRGASDLDRHQDEDRQRQDCNESNLDKKLQFHEDVHAIFDEFHFDPVP